MEGNTTECEIALKELSNSIMSFILNVVLTTDIGLLDISDIICVSMKCYHFSYPQCMHGISGTATPTILQIRRV